jgi:hypothetical protein
VGERERVFYLTNLPVARLYGVNKIIRNFLRVLYTFIQICAESRENVLNLSNDVIYFSKKRGQ